MKTLTSVVKLLILLSAAGLAVLRFVSFKYEAALSADTLRLFFLLSLVSAGVLLVSGIVWVLLERRGEKTGKNR